MAEGLVGLVLAAGAGTRFGGPKALARAADGTPWVALAATALRDGGCGSVLVALGAGAQEAEPLVPEWATVVRVPDWAEGLSATLRAGLTAAADADALAIVPVDTPGLPAAAVARVSASAAPLTQATYRGRPGHPVLVTREHIMPLAASVSGDTGARPYLLAHGVVAVECGDLWDGADVDGRVRPATRRDGSTPPDPPRRAAPARPS